MADINSFPRLFAGLMTNSSHALNKIQFESLTDKGTLNAQPELFIGLKPHKDNKTLSIIDTGTGMTKTDLIAAVRPETENFTEALHGWADNTNMIDQFGVNFYSAYLVVEKVIVTTKHNDDDQYMWESQAGGSFTVTRDQLGRGTKITLFLKEDQLQYLDERMIKDLVKKHSEFISYPIYLWTEKKPELDGPDMEDEGNIVQVAYEWQLISDKKRSGTHKNHLIGHMEVEHKTYDWVLCKTIKDVLGDKAVKVIIAPENFGDSSSCRITSKGILEINPNSAILEDLRKIVETEHNDEYMKAVVQLLFETALLTKRKKAHWSKWAKGLTVCCSIIHVTAVVLSCVMSGLGGYA